MQRLILVGLFSMLVACGKDVADSPAMAVPTSRHATVETRHPIRFLALGDSYTIGEGVVPAEGWPVQLAALLRKEGIAIAEPEIIARTGWTTADLLDAVGDAGLHDVYDLVALQIGVNNQYRGQSQETYREEFVKLLERAIALAGRRPARVLVLSIPDWGVTPFAADDGRSEGDIRAEIDAFNAVNRAEAARLGVSYVDVSPSSREAAHDPALVAGDGLHPSGRMYAGWARLALSSARRAIGD